jgi:hypothetical protein
MPGRAAGGRSLHSYVSGGSTLDSELSVQCSFILDGEELCRLVPQVSYKYNMFMRTLFSRTTTNCDTNFTIDEVLIE